MTAENLTMDLFDQVWSRFVKVAAFLLGMYIMYHEAVADHSDRPYIYAAAIAMMGLQIAEIVESAVRGFGGGTSSKDKDEKSKKSKGRSND